MRKKRHLEVHFIDKSKVQAAHRILHELRHCTHYK